MEFERVTPESVGIPSQAVTDLLNELYRCGIEMHSLMLLRHGKVCAEGWWKPYNPESPHAMFSFSKSLTSTAIGFAVQEGLISLDDRLVDIFPDKLPDNPSENLKKATVRHLLMMGCGHETEIEWGPDQPGDWISTFLSHPFVYEPGTHFLYNTAGTNLLCAILKRKTGQHLTEFLRSRLIKPLGMTDIRCHALPDGTEMGGAGYALTTEDMARFVQFVANKGRWDGKQLLNEDWFRMATGKQIENRGPGWDGDPDWYQGYGFQFWRCQPKDVFRGDGAFGQYGIVFPDQDAVLVITSSSLQLQAVLTAIWEKLLPNMQDAPLAENARQYHVLSHRLKNLELVPMLGMRNPGAEESLNGARYLPDASTPCLSDLIGGTGRFVQEGGVLKGLSLRFAKYGNMVLCCEEDHGSFEMEVGMQGHHVLTEHEGVIYGAVGRWRSGNTLEMELRNTRAVSGARFLFRFSGEKLTVTADSTIPQSGGLAGDAFPGYTFTLSEGEASMKTKMYWEVN